MKNNNSNKFIDTCRLLGNYNGENIYLYSSAKYVRPRIFYIPNYYYLPKFIVNHDKLTFLQAIKIIDYRMKNKNSDNLKPEESYIDTMIDNIKNNNNKFEKNTIKIKKWLKKIFSIVYILYIYIRNGFLQNRHFKSIC